MPSRRQQGYYYKHGIKYYPVALPRPRRPRTRPVLEGSMSRRSSLARSHDNEGYRRRRASRSKRVVASDHQGTRTEVALACREIPNLALIEAEYTRRSKAMEEKIESLEKKVSTHDNFMKSMKAAAQGSGNHHGTRTEVALACREAPTLAPIEAEINRRLQAMEQRLKLIESKVPTHDNFEATKIVQAAAQGNPRLFFGGCHGHDQRRPI